jgi:four helix bundle protein
VKPEIGRKPEDIEERAFRYALRVVGLYQYLERRGGAGRTIGSQLLRSATSVSANIEEARSGCSRKEYAYRFDVAQREAKESLYWLRLLAESGLVQRARLDGLMAETDELVAIITTICVRTKRTLKARTNAEQGNPCT